jgi:hypothetical protein
MLARSVLSLVFLCSLAPAAHAQSTGSFNGTWELDPERSESAHQAEPVGSVVLKIRSTDKELVVDMVRDGQSQLVIYHLDGTQRVSRVGENTITSRLWWEGGRLMTETVYTIKGFPVTTREARSISDDGREMTIEAVVRVEHGYLWNFPRENPAHYGRGTDLYKKRD